MRELREFAQFSEWEPKNGDQFKLFELAVAGVSREDAKVILDMNSNHFNVVYKKLKDNLSGSVSTTSTRSISDFIKKKAEVRKQCNTAMLLLNADKKHAGIPLARAAIRKAEKYGMFELALVLSRELRSYYANVSNNKYYYGFYTEKQEELKKELLAVIEIEDVLYNFIFEIKRGKKDINIEAELEKLPNYDVRGWRFHYCKFLCKIINCQIQRDEIKMLRICSNALDFFDNYHYLPYIVKYSFYYRTIVINITRKDYREAEIMINRCLEDPAIGKLNWQIIMFLRAIAGFHSGKPAIAYNAYNQISNVSKKYQSEEMKERFMVVNAYLSLIGYDIPKKFYIGRFLNSLNILNNDKQSMNVTVIVLELMHYIKARKFSRFIDRIDTLERYIHDHLKGKGRERSINFLRMMQCIVRGGFKLPAIERKAETYLSYLRRTRPNISAETVEIVPYERLWEMALSYIRKKK